MSVWFAAAVVSLLFSTFFGRAMWRRSVNRRLRAGARDVTHGAMVTVVGTICETDQLVEAPLSGKKGVLVVTTAELPELDADGRPLQLSRTTTLPFSIDTANAGIVLVEATHADIALKGTAPRPRNTDREVAFVVAHGRGATVAPVATYRELVLAPGMRIAVHGAALVEDDVHAERGYRDGVPVRTRIVGSPDQRLAIGEPPRP